MSMSSFNKLIGYLEDHDFDSKGNMVIPDIPMDALIVIMVQASWCPHCLAAKPEFQKFAEKHKGKVICLTIQADGDRESEKKLGNRINILNPRFRGFPDYMLFKSGKLIEREIKGRTVEHLEEFAGLL